MLLINLISSLVFSRLDYSCSSLIGQTSITFRRLQSVINASARVAYSRRMTDSISPLLRDLHWLKFRFVWTFGCVNWFIVVLMVQLHLISPHSCKKWKTAAYAPHQASSLLSVASRGRLLEVVLFQWPELACGTAYLIMYWSLTLHKALSALWRSFYIIIIFILILSQWPWNLCGITPLK